MGSRSTSPSPHTVERPVYTRAKHQTINHTATGKTVVIAAAKIAKIVAAVVTGVAGVANFADLLGTLEAGFSNESAEETVDETFVDQETKQLAVLNLRKTTKKNKRIFTLVSGASYEIKVEGELSVITAANDAARLQLREIPTQEAHRMLASLTQNAGIGVEAAAPAPVPEADDEGTPSALPASVPAAAARSALPTDLNDTGRGAAKSGAGSTGEAKAGTSCGEVELEAGSGSTRAAPLTTTTAAAALGGKAPAVAEPSAHEESTGVLALTAPSGVRHLDWYLGQQRRRHLALRRQGTVTWPAAVRPTSVRHLDWRRASSADDTALIDDTALMSLECEQSAPDYYVYNWRITADVVPLVLRCLGLKEYEQTFAGCGINGFEGLDDLLSADLSCHLLDFHWKRLQKWVLGTRSDAGEPFSGRIGELESVLGSATPQQVGKLRLCGLLRALHNKVLGSGNFRDDHAEVDIPPGIVPLEEEPLIEFRLRIKTKLPTDEAERESTRRRLERELQVIVPSHSAKVERLTEGSIILMCTCRTSVDWGLPAALAELSAKGARFAGHLVLPIEGQSGPKVNGFRLRVSATASAADAIGWFLRCGQVPFPLEVREWVEKLRSGWFWQVEEKEEAARELFRLAHNDNNQVAIAMEGGIPPLVALARDGTDGQKQNAAGALCLLAINDDNQVAIAREGGIPPLVALARDGTEKQKEYAAGALANLAHDNADNKVAIARAQT